MTDEQLLLATAYVDDELSPVERAQAENDPEVWAEVQRQRSVQQLAVVTPPYSLELARAQISHAIDRASQHEPDSDAEVATVHSIADRRRRSWWVGGSIAAALLVGVFAGAALLTRDRGEDTVSYSAIESSDATTVDMSSGADVPAAGYDSAIEESAASMAPSSAAAADSSDPPTMAAADSATTLPSDLVLDDPNSFRFATADELVEIGRVIMAGTALGLVDPPPSTCEIPAESGESLAVRALATSTVDGEHPVVIAVDVLDDDDFTVYAADPSDCTVLMSARGSFGR